MENENKQSTEFDGIVLSESVDNAEAVADVTIPENKGNENLSAQEAPKKKKKKKIGKFLVFLIFIALIGGGCYYYLKYMCTSDKFIDYSIKSVNSMVNNIYKNTIDYNILEDDYLGTGELEIKSSDSKYSYLDGLKLEYTVGTSLANDYASLDGKLTQGSYASLSALAFVDKENTYIKSEDVYSLMLNYNLGKNYFTDIKKELEDSNDFTVAEIKKATNNVIKYLGEALKEVSSSSTIDKGIYINYVFNLDKDNYKKFCDKFETLIKNDEQLKVWNEKYSFLDDSSDEYKYDYYEDKKVSIKINAITKEVESFSITSDNESLFGKRIEKNKYKITSDDMVINAEINDKKIDLEINEDNESVGSFTGVMDGNKISFNFKEYEEKVEVYVDITKESNSQMRVSTVVNYGGLSVKNKITNKVGQSLVTKETFNNYRSVEQLSESELSTIQTNLMDKLSQFKAYNSLFSTTSNNNYF